MPRTSAEGPAPLRCRTQAYRYAAGLQRPRGTPSNQNGAIKFLTRLQESCTDYNWFPPESQPGGLLAKTFLLEYTVRTMAPKRRTDL